MKYHARIAAGALLVGAALALEAALTPLELKIDQYKALSTFRRWERQGSAERLLTRNGPRARIDAFASALLHRTLFAGLNATAAPPPQLALLADGHALLVGVPGLAK
ncbi:MAG: hypothetical protein ACOCP9_03430, partial [Halofilum sp. (in: g-proteobacteria)]